MYQIFKAGKINLHCWESGKSLNMRDAKRVLLGALILMLLVIHVHITWVILFGKIH